MTLTVSTIDIENYKSIKNAAVEFGDYNVIIGKNDVGKSSLLEALDLILNFKTPTESEFHLFDEANTMRIVCEFDTISTTLKENLTEPYVDQDNLTIAVQHTSAGSRTPDKVFINNEELTAGAVELGEESLNKSASREYIKEQLPETVTVLAERDYDSATSLTKGSWLTKLMSPIFSSEKLDKQKKAIRSELKDELKDLQISLNKVLSDQHPHINNVRVDVGEIDLTHAISPDIEVRDGNVDEWMQLSGRGSGVGNQLILSMMKSYADSEIGENYSILYEEPENSLHPSAVREMGKALREIADQGNQVILTTHSPSLIDTHENGTLIIVSNENGKAAFTSVEDDGFEAIETIGAKNSDILQSNYVLYTEGASDANVIEVICENEFEDWHSLNVTIQPAGGSNLQRQLNNVKQINRNSGIIIDSDRDGEGGELGRQSSKLKKKAAQINVDCWVLERREIENYFHTEAIESVLELPELVDIGHYDEAENHLKQYNYDNNKVQYAREIAAYMYENELDDEFADLKEIVQQAFN